MPITTARSGGYTFLSVRPDYLQHDYTWHDWHKTEEYKLADEFNYVEYIDVDKLAENCEKIIKKVAELNEIARTEKLDTTKVEEAVFEEILLGKAVLNEAKKDLEWWELESYELRRARNAMKGVENDIKKLESLDFTNMTNAKRRRYVQDFEEYGYVEIREDDYYVETLREYIAKCEK